MTITTPTFAEMKMGFHCSSAVLAFIAGFLCVPFLTHADLVQPISTRGTAIEPSLSAAGDSGSPIVSTNGRYVLFASTANNLAMNTNGMPYSESFPVHMNVFLRDRTLALTRLVSVNVDGNGPGNDNSIPVALSDDGRYALFESAASNLVPGDTNGANDVFMRDMVEGATHLVSATTNGTSGKGTSSDSVMTPDGRYIAFVSTSTNLVLEDTNGIQDVFVRDMQSGSTTLVSVGALRAAKSSLLEDGSKWPRITSDGRYVAFYSTATNLVPGVNRSGGVYIRDLVGQTTVLAVSNALAAVPYTNGSPETVWAEDFCISDDGRYLAFEGVTNFTGPLVATGMVFRSDIQTGITDILHTNVLVFSWRYRPHSLDMTSDGRVVAFIASPGEAPSIARNEAFVWDAVTGSNTLVSVQTNGQPGAGTCESVVLSQDGKYVSFVSSAPGLVTNALDGEFQLYLRELQAGATRLVNVGLDNLGLGLDSATIPALSSDSRFVAFDSTADGFVAGDRNRASDVIIRDMADETNVLVSVGVPGAASITGNGASGFGQFSVSANGRYIAFASDADNLVANDTNHSRDVFVRDLVSGTTVPASADSNGVPLQAFSAEPAISGDGRYVSFTSLASRTGEVAQIWVRDMRQSTTRLASVGLDGLSPGNGASSASSISDDGRWVLFRSRATNIASSSFGTGVEFLFLRDMQSGTNYPLARASSASVIQGAMTPDGRYVAYYGTRPGSSGLYIWDSLSASNVYTNLIQPPFMVAISPDGRRIAYQSGLLTVIDRFAGPPLSLGPTASNTRLQFSGDGRFLLYTTTAKSQPADTNNFEDVYLYDWDAGSRLLVSHIQNDTNAPNGPSGAPIMSLDARYIAYRSFASNIVANDLNDMPDVFLFDRVNGTTMLVSANSLEDSTGSAYSLQPILSSNGQTLAFQSRAANLVAGDLNESSELFAFQFLTAGISMDGAGLPLLSWPALPGHNYRAQYTTNLLNGTWLDVGGSASILGYRGLQADPTPSFGTRFYRIISEKQ